MLIKEISNDERENILSHCRYIHKWHSLSSILETGNFAVVRRGSPSDNYRQFEFIPSSSCQIEKAVAVVNTLVDFHKKKYPNADYIDVHEKIKVLDVGCGVSPLLTYLKDFWGDKGFRRNRINPMGIDIDKNYVNILRASWKIRAVEGDLLNLTDQALEMVNQADFIYSYCPIESPKGIAKMYKHIFRHMKKGAIIMDTFRPISESIGKRNMMKIRCTNVDINPNRIFRKRS